MNKGEVWFVEFPLEEDDIPIIYWEEASLRLASTARVSKVTLLTKDSFIFKIGNLHPDDLSRIEDMYRKFLKDNGAI